MKRQDKYPNTNVFKMHNANPKNRITSDCVIRAISTVTGKKYNDVVMDLAKLQCETGYDSASKQAIDKLLTRYGYTKCKQPRKIDNTKYTGVEFCKELQEGTTFNYDNGVSIDETDNVIAHIGGHHIVAIMNAVIYDHWDSSHGCIGNIWVLKK